MTTFVHFRENGKKRTLCIEGFYTHLEIAGMIQMKVDDHRFMLVYEKS